MGKRYREKKIRDLASGLGATIRMINKPGYLTELNPCGFFKCKFRVDDRIFAFSVLEYAKFI